MVVGGVDPPPRWPSCSALATLVRLRGDPDHRGAAGRSALETQGAVGQMPNPRDDPEYRPGRKGNIAGYPHSVVPLSSV